MAYGKYFLVTAAALTLAAPSTLADWSAFGSFEPNTPYDTDWIWADPPAVGEQKIYFNAISGTHYPPASALGKPYGNPNVAALGTQIEPFGLEYHNAILGVWVDCNGDGYVGMAETAVREYAASLLDSTTVCPLVEGPTAVWTPGAHNYNGWVSELIPIMRGTNLSLDARVYRDDDARVWGDFDRPDELPTYRTCPLFPWPRGTFHNVGGVLNYVDCRQPILEAWNRVMDNAGDPAGLRFGDANDGRTGTVGQVDIGGNEDASHSAATVWDCDAQPAFHSGDTANQTPAGPLLPTTPVNPRNIRIYAIQPQPGNIQDASIAGTANTTAEGLQPLQYALGPDENWDCDTSNDFGHDVYSGAAGLPETDFNGVDPNNKRQANWNFGTSTTTRGGAVVDTTAANTRVHQRADFPVFGGASGAPQDGGVGTGGTRWTSDSTWGSKPGPRTLKIDIGSGQVSLPDAYWLTFYARVGQATLDRGFVLKATTAGTYGEWACGANTVGIHKGWNCNGATWYQNADGSFPNDPLAILAKPGWKYQLRDVDCYDGSVRALGIGVNPSYYGENPCP